MWSHSESRWVFPDEMEGATRLDDQQKHELRQSNRERHKIVVPPTASGNLCDDGRVAYVSTEGRRHARTMVFCQAFFEGDWKAELPAPLNNPNSNRAFTEAEITALKTHGPANDRYSKLGEDHKYQIGLQVIDEEAAGVELRRTRPCMPGTFLLSFKP